MSLLVAENLQKHLDLLATKKKEKIARTLGILYGFRTSSDVVIALMCAFFDEAFLDDSGSLSTFLEQNNQILPTGLDYVGIVSLCDSSQTDPSKCSNLFDILHLCLGQSGMKPDSTLLVINSNESTAVNPDICPISSHGYRLKTTPSLHLVEIPISVKPNEFLQRTYYSCFHLNAHLDSALTPIHSKHGPVKALELKLLELQVENRNDFAYGIQDNSLFLLPSIPSIVVPAGNIGGLVTSSTTIQDFLTLMKKKKEKSVKADVKRDISLLCDATGGLLPDEPTTLKLFYNASDGKGLHGSSPLLTIGHGTTQLIRFCLDTYLFLSNEKTLADIVDAAELSKKRQLAGMVDFLRQSSPNIEEVPCLPLPYQIVNGPNFLTLFSGFENNDVYLNELYSRFGYNKHSPTLRKEASLRSRLHLSKRNLLNVGDKLVKQHSKFLSESQAWQLSLVSGSYTYHHYKQDRFDDDGWGCAYRSLQTLFSWFKLQGFTDAPIPNHEQIQCVLVDIKDREKSLIGSRKWIGSTEIARVLDHLLQVQCRIINVPSGRDLGTAFASLRTHFETEGTPVNIGGGVYAYTIGGVAVNRASGEVKVLVIDPHYVGEDDMESVFKKNGVAWRSPELFWDQNAFYNLCCPLRPNLK